MVNVRYTIIAAKRRCLYQPAEVWSTRRSEFGQYDILLTGLHKLDQRDDINYLRITPDLFQEMAWRVLAHIILLCHDKFTNSWLILHDPFAKFCCDLTFEYFKILIPTWHAVTTGLHTLHASLRLVFALTRLESCQCEPQIRASVKAA